MYSKVIVYRHTASVNNAFRELGLTIKFNRQLLDTAKRHFFMRQKVRGAFISEDKAAIEIRCVLQRHPEVEALYWYSLSQVSLILMPRGRNFTESKFINGMVI